MEHRVSNVRKVHQGGEPGGEVAPLRSVVLGVVFLVLLYALGSPALDLAGETPVDFTIAFIGDQGGGEDAVAVLELIRDEGADAVLHQGDFDYGDDPAAWNALIDDVLGADFPYFASVGNHDEGQFYGAGGYQEFLVSRMTRLGIPWTGDLGVESFFRYQGIFVVLTAPGVFGDGDDDYAPFIRDALASDDSIWSISSWHKNMNAMQVGGKSDDTGWGVYEESRRGGAIIATAHEHSYSRTHLMASLEDQVVASTEQPLVLSEDDPSTSEDEGRSFVFVSGLGGKSIRDQEQGGDWWASVYTSSQEAQPGALFGVFNYQGDPRRALFYFKDVAGNVVDEFVVESGVGQGLDVPQPPPPPRFACDDGLDNDGDGEIDFPNDLGCDDFDDDSEDSEAPSPPDEPTAPEEPTVPDEPTVPEEPTVPDEPTVPEEPMVPDEPTAPQELPLPDEPAVPDVPDETGSSDGMGDGAVTPETETPQARRLARKLERIDRKLARLSAKQEELSQKMVTLGATDPSSGGMRRLARKLATLEARLDAFAARRASLEAALSGL